MASTRVISFLLLASCGALCQQRDGRQLRNSLPDAPSMTSSNLARILHSQHVDSAEIARATVYEDSPVRDQTQDFFAKRLRPTAVISRSGYRPVANETLMGRATYAASNTLIVRHTYGKSELNTSYLLRVLSSSLVHLANRPYWNRPLSAPFSDFGSTIGNDAGMNVLHEFGPGLEQLVKNHEPRFVAKIEDRVTGK